MGQLIVYVGAFLIVACSTFITFHLFRKLIADGITRIFWLISAALVFSVGIWSMHFIAVWNYPFHTTVTYHLGTVFVSLGALILFSFISFLLFLFAFKYARTYLLLIGSIALGAGICLMHFIGMKAVIVEAVMEYRVDKIAVTLLSLIFIIYYVFHKKRMQSEGIIRNILPTFLLSTTVSVLHFLSLPVVHSNPITMAKNFAVQNNPEQNYNNLFMIMIIIVVVIANFMYSTIILLIDKRLKHSEDQLVQVNQMYSLILNSVAEGIFRLNEKREIVFWNVAAEQMTGFLASEVMGKSFDLHVPCEAWKKPIDEAIAERAVKFVPEALLHMKNGSTFQAEYHVTPMYNEHGFTGAVINFTDISARKKSESMMRETEKLSLAGQLAAGIAHEIRNPLTAIKGFTQLLQKGIQKTDYIPIMNSEINRMELIISELLTLSKPHLNNVKQVDLCDLLDSVVMIIESQAIMNNVEIKTEYAEPVCYINCDANQIKQVFINIVKNAIEASHGGMVLIQVESTGDKVVTSIVDNGSGIPEDVMEQIGQPFFSTKEKGTGLGLMISSKILSSHDGTMQIKSKANVGTTFEIILPVSSLIAV